ncbi:B12-binding domain-containing radical SAM protein [Chloroflexota bacterium]
MKISIAYPPIPSSKGIPEISQNRQFNWFSNPTYVYPVVPAYAATLLNHAGYDVLWDDGIAEEMGLPAYLERMSRSKPDLVVMETKTPVIKTQWKIIEMLKERLPDTKVVLVGDHVTALPEESMERRGVDYVLTGGDYDFLLLNLCNHLSKGEALEPGIWYRDNDVIKNAGQFLLNHDLNSLPFIDRDLTLWRLYSEKNGNFKKLPGTYTMAGRDCWWHNCTFCAWTVLYPKYRVRTPESLLDEVGELIERYNVREIFDDTGTFPVGNWLERFCRGMIDRGYHHRVNIGCNLRFGAVKPEQYDLMKEAGFRYILFGFESANQSTLDRICKGLKVNDVIEGCRLVKKAGLEPHITAMIGYPWETEQDASRTIALAQDIFREGNADTLQATLVVPYPGTPLFKECRENGWLLTEDWDDYDMRQPVMKTPMDGDTLLQYTQNLYRIFFTPGYVLRRLRSIRSFEDIKFLVRGAMKVLGHLKDFGRQGNVVK